MSSPLVDEVDEGVNAVLVRVARRMGDDEGRPAVNVDLDGDEALLPRLRPVGPVSRPAVDERAAGSDRLSAVLAVTE